MVKNLFANAEDTRDIGSIPGSGREDPLKQKMAVHSSILPGKFCGQRVLVPYIPWGSQRIGYILVHTRTRACVRTHTHTLLIMQLYMQ